MNDFLTVAEYSKLEGISHQAAYMRLRQGQVPAKRFLGRWLIEPPEKEPAGNAGLRQLVGPDTPKVLDV